MTFQAPGFPERLLRSRDNCVDLKTNMQPPGVNDQIVDFDDTSSTNSPVRQKYCPSGSSEDEEDIDLETAKLQPLNKQNNPKPSSQGGSLTPLENGNMAKEVVMGPCRSITQKQSQQWGEGGGGDLVEKPPECWRSGKSTATALPNVPKNGMKKKVVGSRSRDHIRLSDETCV